MLLGALGATILWNLSECQGTIRKDEGTFRTGQEFSFLLFL